MKKELMCKEKDGFWFCSIFHYQGASLSKDAIIIDENSTDKFVSYINKKRIDKIIIDSFNCDLDSLSFLNKIKHVKYITVLGNGVIDISPIYDLENLLFLEILNPSDLYLDKVRGLQFFSTNKVCNIKNIDKAVTLKTLKLIDPINDNCNLNDLDILKNLKSLEILSLTGYGLNSLKGINHLTNLKVLVLNDLKKLTNIDDLVDLKSSLTSLRIFNCKKIEKYDTLSNLENLKFLSMDKLSPITNLHFINSLHKLKTFISKNTQIIDGNISVLTKVETAIVTPVKNAYHVLDQGKMIKFRQREMPYNKRCYGDEEIEIWRRISY